MRQKESKYEQNKVTKRGVECVQRILTWMPDNGVPKYGWLIKIRGYDTSLSYC